MKLSVRINGTYIVPNEDAQYAQEIGLDVAIQQLVKQIKSDELFEDFETVDVEIDVIDIDKNKDDVEQILIRKNVENKKRRRATPCNDPECEECRE